MKLSSSLSLTLFRCDCRKGEGLDGAREQAESASGDFEYIKFI